MSKLLSRIGLVSAYTMVSRVLGLLRDMLTSAMLGTSLFNDAFITAFMVPNLFRRLLGEGALTAALMPNLSEELETRGRTAVHELINKTLSWLVVVCCGLIGLAWLGLELLKRQYGVESGEEAEKWALVARLGQILFPYVLLVCVAAVMAAALNLFHRFAIPALTAVWLNVSIIVALGVGGWWLGEDLEGRTYWLCAGSMLGGFLQMVVPAWALTREGWRPRWDLALSPRLREVAALTAPGIFSAAVFQINVMVSRGLAFYVEEGGASMLYYANRLVELPVGVFAVAISTVIFPALTASIAGGRLGDFSATYKRGIVLCSLMAAPSAVGLGVLAPEIIALLFERGLFGSSDTAAVTPLLWVFAAGMPFYSFIAVETRAFYALKDTRTPVRVAAVAFGVNLVLSLALMGRLGVVGLAIASNAAAVVQAVGLHLLLRKKDVDTGLQVLLRDAGRILLASAAMGGALWGCLSAGGAAWGHLATVGLLIPLGAGVYFLCLKLTGLDIKGLLSKD